MDNIKLANNIEELCSAIGKKACNVCEEAGVGACLVSDIRRGHMPSIVKVVKLARYFGVTTSELLGEALPERPFTEPELDDQIRKLMEGLTPEEFAKAIAIARAIKESEK